MLAILAAVLTVLAPHAPTSPIPADPNPTTGVANPNVTDANVGQTICVSGWTKTVRPPASYTNKLKRQFLPSGTNLHLFEEDHVWPIEDGGDPRNPENLRPQYWWGPDGAHTKDAEVENVVHRAICVTHTMTLEQGHAAISAWIAAHHPYPIPTQPAP